MGEPLNRFARGPQRSRLQPAAVATGAVIAVALVFALLGVDPIEIVATLMFAAVFVAALIVGSTAGYGAALAAGLVYLGLRLGDIDDSGAANVAVLVVARGLCYAALAHFTPLVADRIPVLASARSSSPDHGPAPQAAGAAAPVGEEWTDRVPEPVAEPAYAGAGSGHAEPGYPEPGYPEPHGVGMGPSESVAVGGGWTEAPVEEAGWDQAVEPPPPAPWGPPLSDPYAGEGVEPVPAFADAAPGPWPDPAPTYDGAAAPREVIDDPPDVWQVDEPYVVSHDAGPSMSQTAAPPRTPVPPLAATPAWVGGWDDQPPAPASSYSSGPPAPSVPTGWIDDATVPLGDETIPVGYTGELFLPRDLRSQPLAGHPSPLTSGNGSTNGRGTHRRTTGRAPALPPGDPSVGTPPTPSPTPSSPPPPPPPAPVEPWAGGGDRGGIAGGPPGGAGAHPEAGPAVDGSEAVDPETRLWNARSFRDRLTDAHERARRTASPFSVVMVQVPDAPFQALPYRRQVALLRELGHQFVQARLLDHLVHLPDGAKHWFAVVLPDTDRAAAQLFERRLRSAINGYLRSRGLRMTDVQSASLTSPDDDQAMQAVWSSLLGSARSPS